MNEFIGEHLKRLIQKIAMRSKRSKSRTSTKSSHSSSKKHKTHQLEKSYASQEVQTTQEVVCLCCDMKIPDGAILQAHLILFKHSERTVNEELICRGCFLYVTPDYMNTHKCILLKAFYIRYVMSSQVLSCGPPYRCLYCRSHFLGSRIELALHLLGIHRHKQAEDLCGICNEKLDSISTHSGGSKKSSKEKSHSSRSSRKSKRKSPKRKKSKSPARKSKSPSSRKSRSRSSKGGDKKETKSQNEEYEVDEKLIERLRKANRHLMEEHARIFSYEAQNRIKDESLLSQPYACTFCELVMENNVEFHAHILCCHGNKSDIENRLCICSWCQQYTDSMEVLHYHVRTRHAKEIEDLCSLWLRREHMQNYSDPSTTCATCWMKFGDVAQLSSHILVHHTNYQKLKCGLCSRSYVNCENLQLALEVLGNHEKNHRSAIVSQSAHRELFPDSVLPVDLPEALTTDEYERAKARREESLAPPVVEKKTSKSSSRNSSPKTSRRSNSKKKKSK